MNKRTLTIGAGLAAAVGGLILLAKRGEGAPGEVPPEPEPELASLYGVVINSLNSEALPGVRVTIASTTTEKETSTNSEGYYSFENIPQGEYMAEFTKDGFETARGSIPLGAGLSELNMALNPIVTPPEEEQPPGPPPAEIGLWDLFGIYLAKQNPNVFTSAAIASCMHNKAGKPLGPWPGHFNALPGGPSPTYTRLASFMKSCADEHPEFLTLYAKSIPSPQEGAGWVHDLPNQSAHIGQVVRDTETFTETITSIYEIEGDYAYRSSIVYKVSLWYLCSTTGAMGTLMNWIDHAWFAATYNTG